MSAAGDAPKTLAPEAAPGDAAGSPPSVLAGARGRLTLAATCSITLSTTTRLASGRTVVPEAALPISLFLLPEELDALQRLARALRSGHAALVRAALGRQRTVEPQAAEQVLVALCREALAASPLLRELLAVSEPPFRLVPRRPLQREQPQAPLRVLRVLLDRLPERPSEPPDAPGPPPLLLDLRGAPLAGFGRALGWLSAGIDADALRARLLTEAPEVGVAVAALLRHGVVQGDAAGPRLELLPGELAHLGHATLLANLGGAHVLIDPWLPAQSRVDILPPLAVAALPELAAILLTHHHFDHLNVDTLLRLDKAVPIYIPAPVGGAALEPRSRELLRYLGFSDVRELVPGEVIELGDGGQVAAAPFYGEDPTLLGYRGLCYVLVHDGAAALVHVDSSTDHRGCSLVSTGEAAALVRRFGPMALVLATRRQERGLMLDYPFEFLLQPAPLWVAPTENCCNDAAFLGALCRACGTTRLVLYSEGGADFYPDGTDFLRRPSTPARCAPYEYLWDPLVRIEDASREAGAALCVSSPYDVFRIGDGARPPGPVRRVSP
ncbi:MAG: MBL fold metallo-hydrolase [Polyangia bacterium]